jgi:hypothetical protein
VFVEMNDFVAPKDAFLKSVAGWQVKNEKLRNFSTLGGGGATSAQVSLFWKALECSCSWFFGFFVATPSPTPFAPTVGLCGVCSFLELSRLLMVPFLVCENEYSDHGPH